MMSDGIDLVPATTLKRFTLPESTAEEFRLESMQGPIVHLVAPLTRGEGRLVVNGRLVHTGALLPGMLRILNPADDEERLVTKPLEVLVFTLPFDRLKHLSMRQSSLETRDDEPFDRCDIVKHRLVQQLTSTAMLADELAPEAQPVFIDGITEALVGVLLNHYRKQSEAGRRDSQRGLSTRQLRDCLAFADEHLGQKLRLSEWADIVRLSTSEFGRRFQASTKLTPYAWFIDRRIERAQELLQRRSTTISDLAFTLGFTSQSHFTEAFRRRTGMSPARWRSLRKEFDSVAVS